VLGLPAASSPLVGTKHPQDDNEGVHDEAGSELKRKKSGCWLFKIVKHHLLLMGLLGIM